MSACKTCLKETNNPKFCSRTCAARLNNKIPKRKKTVYLCSVCQSPTRYRRKFCSLHAPGNTDWNSYQIGEIKSTHRYSRHMHIRELARKKYLLSSLLHCCVWCGYNKHIEVCHVRPIADFPITSLVREVNSLDNLVGLCRNHHWELDNGILSIEQICRNYLVAP